MASETNRMLVTKKESILLSRNEIGSKLEGLGFQMAVCTFIYLDVVAFIYLFVAENSIDVTEDAIEMIPNLVTSFLNFTLFGFSIELLSLGYAFGFSLFHHFGYILDILTISTILYNELYDWSPYPMRFLMVFRMWRVFRLIHTWVQIVQIQLDDSKLKLVKSRQKVKQLELNLGPLEDSIKKERKLREGLERTIQSCREEIETLNEALQIAAIDVAKLKLDNTDSIDAEVRTEIESEIAEVFLDTDEVQDDIIEYIDN